MTQLKATSITVSEVSGFNKNGSVFKAERLEFFVGNHGPFTKLFPAGVDNTAAFQLYINSKVQQLQALQQNNS